LVIHDKIIVDSYETNQIPLQNRTGMSQQTLLHLKSIANKSDDPFMRPLARWFQVEARLPLPYGVFYNTENYEYEQAFQLTKKHY
jgi:hypothetical protein